MRAARRLVEAPPSIRWHLARVRGPLYRRAFAGFGPGSVIVRPRVLRGVEHIRIGSRCAVNAGVWLQVEAGGGPLHIGDDAYLGHRVHIHCLDPVTVGDRVHIVDDVYIGSADHDRADRSAVHGSGPVVVGDDVFIGQRAVVLGGVSIGAGATVGAGAVVTHDVPAGATVAGVPARVVGATP
ncbi:DapH/DapD/GlmU-related protein [uncultured Phycicoccus sp.]|uniref:acyltransferase n=1 Tax=uncultured Phycicoccus sp. TaxID=661422 RepID=UPI002613C740|nr:DapH/DapD/GlmU-related protein [uncultured Phycicoccus sp.]